MAFSNFLSLPPPSLADINWSPPEDGNLDDDVQTCLWKDRTTSWFSLDTPNNPGKSSNYISRIKIDDEFLIVITMFSRYGWPRIDAFYWTLSWRWKNSKNRSACSGDNDAVFHKKYRLLQISKEILFGYQSWIWT